MIKTRCLACGLEDINLHGGPETFSTCPKCEAKSMNKDWRENYKNAHKNESKYYYYSCPECANKYRTENRNYGVTCVKCRSTMTELTDPAPGYGQHPAPDDPIRIIKINTSSLRGQYREQMMDEWQKKIDAMSPFDFYFERRYAGVCIDDDIRKMLELAFDAGQNHEEYG